MIEIKGYVHDRSVNFFKGSKDTPIKRTIHRGNHGTLGSVPKDHRPTRKRIPRVSKKKREQDKIYAKLRPQFLAEHPTCEIQWDEKCSKKATQVHHVKRRGKYYLKTETWKSSCRHCHAMVEHNGKEAERRGHLIYERKAENNT